MLSEKAKGKQRATEPPVEPEPDLSRDLVIRFTEGIPDLVLKISEKDAIRNVKSNVCRSLIQLLFFLVIDLLVQIRKARPQLTDRRLRLIHSGRLLTDGTLLYSWITTLEERQRRATSDEANEMQQPSNITTWLHCSVGPKVEHGEESEETNTQVCVNFPRLDLSLTSRRQLSCNL
jgi:hypothetical protein